MDQVVRELGETVQLAQLDGRENVYIAISNSPHPMRLASSVGVRLPAHATGIGKALLSLVPPAEIERRLGDRPLERVTEATVVDRGRLLDVLDEARARGYAVDNEEYLAGCCCTAVPVGRDPRRGGVPIALSITMPTSRAREPWPDAYVGPLLDVAAKIRAEAGLLI